MAMKRMPAIGLRHSSVVDRSQVKACVAVADGLCELIAAVASLRNGKALRNGCNSGLGLSRRLPRSLRPSPFRNQGDER